MVVDTAIAVERYVTFVGYPRSGHSLTGSLLDAHPEMIIAHELDALQMLEQGVTKQEIWEAILKNSRDYSLNDRKWGEYTYAVPGQWNGKFRNLRVLGDKKGGRSTLRLFQNPKLLPCLMETMEVRCQFVHILRNPYDNISTMARHGNMELAKAIEDYFWRCDAISKIRPRVASSDWIDLRHEDVVADPKAKLQLLCEFLGCQTTEDYLTDCASIVFPSPKKTRASAPWTPEFISLVEERMKPFELLSGYSFDS